MKKNLILTIFINSLFTIYAQTDKSYIILGSDSDLSFISTHRKISTTANSESLENNSKYFDFSIFGGYFVFENFSLGSKINYSKNKFDDVVNTSYMIGPMVRYYFYKNEKLMTYAQSILSYGSNTYPVYNYDTYGKLINDKKHSDLYGSEIDLGVAFLLSKKVSIDIILGYNYTREIVPFEDIYNKPQETYIDKNSFGINFGFSMYLGKESK